MDAAPEVPLAFTRAELAPNPFNPALTIAWRSATASRHRKAAFEAADFLMDYLKSRAPFWKNERVAGQDRWVAATSEDEDALKAWDTGA